MDTEIAAAVGMADGAGQQALGGSYTGWWKARQCRSTARSL
ncbi:MAG: hypothetical protein R2874_14955 [Desulfobacterales bacterium]